jgi:hypothetical protein
MQRKQAIYALLLLGGGLAVVAFVPVPAYQIYSQSRTIVDNLAIQQVSNNGPLATWIDVFHLDMGRYPVDLNELLQPPGDPKEKERWNGPYVKDARDLRDQWGRPIGYRRGDEPGGPPYCLWSNGPDGLTGTADDIRAPTERTQ